VDDVDLMGFVVPPIDFHLGLPRWEHWTLQVDELDVVLYSLEKAVRLLLKGNPNIVGLLWLRETEYVHRHSAFDLLRTRRDTFSSQVTADAFAGYAAGQLKRMEAFDLERMGEYETLTNAISAKGPVREVLEADAQKLRHIAEFITTGTLQVYRTTDADELKVIKRGGWTLDQVKAEAERLFDGVEAARAQSPLPPEPDEHAANELLIDLHRRFLGV
jgi:hypothetical protein